MASVAWYQEEGRRFDGSERSSLPLFCMHVHVCMVKRQVLGAHKPNLCHRHIYVWLYIGEDTVSHLTAERLEL